MALDTTPDLYIEDPAYLMAATAELNQGEIVLLDADGYAIPGTAATGLTAVGIAKLSVDNSAGDDGDKAVVVQHSHTFRGLRAFRVLNSGTNPVTQAHVRKDCYVEGPNTVGSLAAGHSRAGTVHKVQTIGAQSYVWVIFDK